MSAQIRFFLKNNADYSNPLVTATASENSSIAARTLNRNNLTSWVTTGSVDSNNTTLTIMFNEPKYVDSLLYLKHNFKSFKAEWYDGAFWNAFPTAVDVTACADTSSFFSFARTSCLGVKTTIRGTQVANSDKYLYQFIATQQLAQFQGWPIISNAKHDQNKQTTKLLSGRTNINKNLGGFSCDLNVKVWNSQADLDAVTALYDATDGFLVWLGGGDLSQFSFGVKGYRLEDIYLMKCANDLAPNWYNGFYKSGVGNLKIQLVEVNE